MEDAIDWVVYLIGIVEADNPEGVNFLTAQCDLDLASLTLPRAVMHKFARRLQCEPLQ